MQAYQKQSSRKRERGKEIATPRVYRSIYVRKGFFKTNEGKDNQFITAGAQRITILDKSSIVSFFQSVVDVATVTVFMYSTYKQVE